MDIEKILEKIAEDKGMDKEEVRNANFYNVFDREPEDTNCLGEFSMYIYPTIPDEPTDKKSILGYSLDVEPNDDGTAEVVLTKTLVFDVSLEGKNEEPVLHTSRISTTITRLYVGTEGYYGTRTKDDELPTVGELLEWIKSCYDDMEQYQREHLIFNK